jgi:biopolymer transport protein TolQ
MHPLIIKPLLGSAFQFALKEATPEGKTTIGTLLVVSLFSWTVIITKTRQLMRARGMARKFFAAYRATRDPLELFRKKEDYDGAPANEIYQAGAEELSYQLKNNPVEVVTVKPLGNDPGLGHGNTDVLARSRVLKISKASFDAVRIALERSVSAEGLALEKGMIVLSTAVAGGPFIGLLGTVWGVMETFSGVAQAKAASLTAMAPGVAGALAATVTGLMVAIPAMFAYNFMVTTIRAITQELDNFVSEYATHIEHQYVDNRSLADEITDALKKSRGEYAEEAS